MAYRVNYLMTGTDEATDNSVRDLNYNAGDEDGAELNEIIRNCKDLGVDAELYDAAGFRKGYVKKDGNYSLA